MEKTSENIVEEGAIVKFFGPFIELFTELFSAHMHIWIQKKTYLVLQLPYARVLPQYFS